MDKSVKPGLSLISGDSPEIFNIRKKDIKSFTENLQQLIANGDIDSLKARVASKAWLEFFKAIDEAIKDSGDDYTAALKYEAKFMMGPFSIERSESLGARTDYNSCGYPGYAELIAQKEDLDLKIKEVEAFLSTIKKPTEFIDPSTGEMTTIMPPIKRGKSGLKMTMK